MKKTLSVLLSVLFIGMAAPVNAEKNFDEEIRSYPWAEESVRYCMENGIIEGDEFGKLNLGSNLTRAQMARIFTDTFSLKESQNAFEDVKKTDWFYTYSRSIKDSMPKSFDKFDGGEKVTREEFAATLVKASGGQASDNYTAARVSFRDAGEVDDDYKNWLNAAAVNLYMLGDEGYIKPKALLTRAEACAFLYRAVNPDAGKTPITGDAEVTLKQALAWAKAKNADEIYLNVAPIYWEYGEQFGLRPEILFAQAGKETGYGHYGGAVLPGMNNWAGIKTRYGVGDETEDHETFSSPEEGVRAHFNHMCAYVGLKPIGEPHGRYYAVMTVPWVGTVKYVEQLGGRWYADVSYGYDILKMAEEMKLY